MKLEKIHKLLETASRNIFFRLNKSTDIVKKVPTNEVYVLVDGKRKDIQDIKDVDGEVQITLKD